MIGVDLNQAISLDIQLAGRGKPIRCRYCSIKLRITDGKQETYEWDAIVGFVSVPMKFPLLGQAGFLQYFDTNFLGADHAAELLPNRAFSGTRI